MECHLNVTQGFIPLGGAATIMVVAPPTEDAFPDATPGPEDLRAFLMDGSQGVMLWIGTWHALKRFPVRPPHADMVMFTGADTQREIETRTPGGPPPMLTRVVDLAATHHVEVRLSDPGNLLGPN
jgi:ureidoglycolate hydrolase